MPRPCPPRACCWASIPETGEKVTRRAGRFGPYLQLGEAVEGEKPQRASIPKGKKPEDITLEEALKLLSLPREVGIHPETASPSSPISAASGPSSCMTAPMPISKAPEDVFTIGINRAVDMLAEKKARGFPRPKAGALKDLGAHPDGGGNIQVMSGRYGPYVKFGKVNATLPRDKDPQTLTVEEAVALIAEREGKSPAQEEGAGEEGGGEEGGGEESPGQEGCREEAEGGREASPKPPTLSEPERRRLAETA